MSENANRSNEGLVGLQEYIDRVLEPSESLARLLMSAQGDVKFVYRSDIELKANFTDVAQISGALNSLARSRLLAFADKLYERSGGVVVGIPGQGNADEIVVDYEVSSVHMSPFTSILSPKKDKKQ